MTRTQISAYLRPADMSEAWDLLGAGRADVRALSGGTDLAIACPPEVTTLVDLSAVVPDGIARSDTGLEIGAMATLTDIAENSDVAAWATGVVPEMLVEVGTPLLRNVCTIGGHLARGKLSDVIPVLLALDAEVAYHAGSEVRLPLDRYYSEGIFRTPHMLIRIILPPVRSPVGCSFSRFARTAYDFPMANCCVRVGADVRIVVGAVPHRGQRAFEAEEVVAAGPLDEKTFARAAEAAAAEVVTGTSWVAGADYRTQLVRVLVRRGLAESAARLEAS